MPRKSRVPKEIKEKNFCSIACQANAPKYNTVCATCEAPIIKRVTQTFENKTGNFYCNRECYSKALNKNSFTLESRLHTKYQKLRNQALGKINPERKCANCGCDILEVLEINHKNGGGNKEMRCNYYGNTINFLKDIISGNRKIDDLEIRCKICNILHYVESVRGVNGFIVKYDKSIRLCI